METQTQTRLVDTVGEGEGETNWGSSIETYTSTCVKWVASGKSLYDLGSLNPVLSDSLGGDGMGWEVGERFRKEGTHVYLWLIHVDVWQKPTQYCQVTIVQ